MIGPGNLHFIACREKFEIRFDLEFPAHGDGEISHRDWDRRSHIEDLTIRCRDKWSGDQGLHQVPDVRKRSLLETIPENRQRLIPHDAIHEDANDVAVAISDVLELSVDIVRTEDCPVQTKLLMSGLQIQFDRQLGDSIRVFRLRQHGFQHGNLTASIDGYRTGEDKMLHVVPYRGVDEIDAADQVVRVVKSSDEVAEPFSGIGGEVEHISKCVLAKQPFDEFWISDTACDKVDSRRFGNVFEETSGKIIQNDNLPSRERRFAEQVPCQVGSEESSSAGDKN